MLRGGVSLPDRLTTRLKATFLFVAGFREDRAVRNKQLKSYKKVTKRQNLSNAALRPMLASHKVIAVSLVLD